MRPVDGALDVPTGCVGARRPTPHERPRLGALAKHEERDLHAVGGPLEHPTTLSRLMMLKHPPITIFGGLGGLDGPLGRPTQADRFKRPAASVITVLASVLLR